MLKREDNVTADLEQVNTFLKDRMSAVEGGFLNIFCAKRGKDHRFDFFQPHELGKATDYAVNLADAGYDIYFNQSFLKDKPSKGRGATADAMATLGVWFDLDVAGPQYPYNPQNPSGKVNSTDITDITHGNEGIKRTSEAQGESNVRLFNSKALGRVVEVVPDRRHPNAMLFDGVQYKMDEMRKLKELDRDSLIAAHDVKREFQGEVQWK
jgi:hypothetical protein